MKYIIYTLGCKVNQYETQAIEKILRERGHEPCAEGETADAVIINTCAVTAEAGRKSRQAINRLREENPGAVCAVSGCYSQLSPDAVERLGADIVYGTSEHIKLVSALESAVLNGGGERLLDKPFERRVFEELPAGAVSGHTRALLKIQDGCANFCTYCIIPYTRGRLRSLPLEAAAKQAAELDAAGYRELVITGIEIASYGAELADGSDLADVVLAISKAAPHTRLRLGSLEPSIVTPSFCERLSAVPNLCRHFHLSLQSGCDEVLKAMNRKYDTERAFAALDLLRKSFPDCGATIDLIAGFPGETEENHAATLDFLRRCAFSGAHIFPYSRRPGTPADKFPNQLDRAVRARRAKEARAVVEKTRESYLRSMLGKTLPVLFETREGGRWQGHSDNYLLVRAGGESLRGQVKNVRINEVFEDFLVGNVI